MKETLTKNEANTRAIEALGIKHTHNISDTMEEAAELAGMKPHHIGYALRLSKVAEVGNDYFNTFRQAKNSRVRKDALDGAIELLLLERKWRDDPEFQAQVEKGIAAKSNWKILTEESKRGEAIRDALIEKLKERRAMSSTDGPPSDEHARITSPTYTSDASTKAYRE